MSGRVALEPRWLEGISAYVFPQPGRHSDCEACGLLGPVLARIPLGTQVVVTGHQVIGSGNVVNTSPSRTGWGGKMMHTAGFPLAVGLPREDVRTLVRKKR